jgi:endonuclease-8
MPEGPSIVILREEAAHFAGKKVVRASGNTKLIDPQRMVGEKIVALRSHGKQFLVEFRGFALRVHFMLFGKYLIDARRETGTPRLSIGFNQGEINFYACSVRYVEGDLDKLYDWSSDVMSDRWNPRKARAKLKQQPATLACDALLDQDVFAGAGNIIKNEVLYRIRVHPCSRIGKLPARKLGELVKQARQYSFDFYEWKKRYVLRKHWCVHAKTICPRCQIRLRYAKSLGKKRRRAFFCGKCQVRYTSP